MTSGRGERLRDLVVKWREVASILRSGAEMIYGSTGAIARENAHVHEACASELEALVASLSETPSQALKCLCGHEQEYHNEGNGCMAETARDETCRCQKFMPIMLSEEAELTKMEQRGVKWMQSESSEDRSPAPPTTYRQGFIDALKASEDQVRRILTSDADSEDREQRLYKWLDYAQVMASDTAPAPTVTVGAPAQVPVSKGESFRVRHVPHEAHIWVIEQAELGERTDYKQGLPEYRIDAAEKAFVAGWRASLLAKGIQP